MTTPEAVEKAYPSWHGIGYRLPESGYFCGICPLADSVKLGFEFGVLLPDPQGLLEGQGSAASGNHLTTGKAGKIRYDQGRGQAIR